VRIAVPLYLENPVDSPSQGFNAAAASADTRPARSWRVFCRQRLSEGTSAALAQVGFQPVTDPLLEHLELRLLFSDGTPV